MAPSPMHPKPFSHAVCSPMQAQAQAKTSGCKLVHCRGDIRSSPVAGAGFMAPFCSLYTQLPHGIFFVKGLL